MVQRQLTVDEYFAQERVSLEKHEFFNGEIFPMAGASRRHALIETNLIAELRDALRHSPCEVYGSDLRVHVPGTGLYTYPDVSIASQPEFMAAHPDTLLNPLVLIEVLSDSTAAYDRGDKFKSYRTISSLTDYILVAQDVLLIECYTRQPDGSWGLYQVPADGQLGLTAPPCAHCKISPIEIYRRVFF